MKITGERIKKRRKELGLSADQLAAAIGKSRAELYRYESGEIVNISISCLGPLAKALQVDMTWLLGEDTETSNAGMLVGTRIRAERTKLGLTLEDLLSAIATPETEDKQLICSLLCAACRETRGLFDLLALRYNKEQETVTAFFPGGSKVINVAMDSGTAMIRDIMKNIE